MASYSSKLKTWGAVGSEYPDSYNYSEGEQPVDAWDNYLTYNVVEDLLHLVDVTNQRIESDSGAAYPSSPDAGHLTHRTDSPDGSGKEELHQYDATNATWDRLLKASGDQMSGVLDMGGYQITDGNGSVTVDGITGPGGDLNVASRMHVGENATVNGNSVYHGGNTTLSPFHKEDTKTLAAGDRQIEVYNGFSEMVPSVARLEATEADAYAEITFYYENATEFKLKHTNSGAWEEDEFPNLDGKKVVEVEFAFDNQSGVEATMTCALQGMSLQ